MSRAIWVVYRKEFLDAIRDRRTLFSMVVVPVLVMPALIFGMGLGAAKMVMKARAEIPKVMLLGGEQSPNTMTALRKLSTIEAIPATADYTNLISEKKVRAAVEVPADFDAALARGEPRTVRIYMYQGELRSAFSTEPVEQYFRALRETEVQRRLTERGVPAAVLHPFEVRQMNVAAPKKVTANLLGAILPYLIILFCFTGGMYPAVDMTAGEKERGTMETLLCSPVARTHLVLGKFLMVLTASVATTALSLTSMGFSFMQAKQHLLGGLAHGPGGAALAMDFPSLVAVFAMVLPLAIFFSALQLAIALFSRSAKEAQSYLGPLTIVVIFPAIASLLPGMELSPQLALVPILNTSLICKEILAGTYHWGYISLIFLSACLYAALALGAAVWLFRRESVLFRV
jgi:sodium transport system permease protein